MVLTPSAHKPESAVSVSEIGKADGIVPMSSQLPHQHLIFWLRAAIRSVSDIEPGPRPVIRNNPVADTKAAGGPGSPGRKTWGTCAIVVLKSYPLPGYGINCRGCRSFVSIAPQVIWPQTVDIKVDNSHILSPYDSIGAVRLLSVVQNRKVFGTLIRIQTQYIVLSSHIYSIYCGIPLSPDKIISYHSPITYSIPPFFQKVYHKSP
jgi:hypothetical protein